MANTEEVKYLEYKGRPLVKRGNTVIYGDIADEYYVCMEILDTESHDDLELATDVVVTLMNGTRIEKKAEREGLYRALDIGAYWLEEAINQ